MNNSPSSASRVDSLITAEVQKRCSDPERERIYTRPVAAEVLIDAGMTVERSTWEYRIATGASGMLHLLARKHVLPLTLPVLAAWRR